MNIAQQWTARQAKHSALCPACSRDSLTDVLDAGELPLSVGVVYPTRAEALDAPLGRVALAYCDDCGLVSNRANDPELKFFEPGYEVALHHSDTFREFINGVAERLADRFDLNAKRIVEIGCGDAYFLKKLASLGNNACVGIDPTVAKIGDLPVERGSVSLLRDYFGRPHRELGADFVCCLSVFEAVPAPGNMLADVHAMASKTNAPIYFEVFNAWRAFEQGEVWSAHYEQCNYFSLSSLRHLFERNGFHVEEADTCYAGDQYLYVIARPVPHKPGQLQERPIGNEREVLREFGRAYTDRHAHWERELARYRAEGLRIMLWGTGGKGITFLNSLRGAEIIEYVAEINPDKQNKYVPGTGQRIVSPQFLAEYQPDKIIITNALYSEEMQRQARELGVNAEFLVA